MYLNYLASLAYYIPELITCATMFALILIESAYRREERGRTIFNFCAYLGLGVVAVTLCQGLAHKGTSIFTGSVVIDPFATLMKIIMVLGTLGVVYLSGHSKDISSRLKSEFVIISVGVLVGGMLLASASNMLILYIGIETLSILSYVLAAMRKEDERSAEAGLKYALYGGVTSGIMLFGISHIFGVTGTIHFASLAEQLGNLSAGELSVVLPAFFLFFAGIGYKIACVPFHMWSPDVYEGSPLPVTALFSIVPKMAGMAVIIRVSMSLFGVEEGVLQSSWVGLLSVVAAVTMTVGNISAIGQKSIKRMLAYSSISHAGMMLMGVVVLSNEGVRSILFYGVTYLFMTLVAFYIVSFVNDKYGNDHFERFNGLVFRYPLVAVMLSIVMFSLAGLPPLSGFVAKFNILAAIIEQKHYTLGVIAVVNSAISLYYYLRIVRLMVFRPAEDTGAISGLGHVNQGLVFLLTLPVVFLGIFWSSLMNLAGGAKIFVE